MLVLKRLAQQEIKIGPDITIKIVDAGYGWARIGITAPDDVVILRSELLPLRAEQPEAAT